MDRESAEINTGYYRRESRGRGVRHLIGYGLGLVGVAALMNVVSAQCYEFVGNRYADSWSKEMAAKLSGETSLSPDEEPSSRMSVVAAGETLADRLAMEQSRRPVNVRNYPATVFPNGVESKIIGRVAQGTEIFDVILTRGVQPNSPVMGKWGAFNCDFVPATGWAERPSEVKPGQTRICAIYYDYLSGQ